MNELFAEDSPFLREETRKTRWAIPYDHECLNARADILLGRNDDALSGKTVLDAGAHMGDDVLCGLAIGSELCSCGGCGGGDGGARVEIIF